jgi:DeoR family fructose operon transcriptional repressor
MVGCGHLVVALADASKFGIETAVRFAGPSDVDVVITDSAVAPSDRRALTRAGIEVVTT